MPRGRHPHPSPEAMYKRSMEGAALLGAGIPPEQIAETLHVSKRTVGKIRAECRTDEQLREIFEESQRKSIPKVLDVADLALDAMAAGLVKEDCPVHHAAAAYRELAKSAGEAAQRVQEKGEAGLDDLPSKDVHILMDLLRQMFREERTQARAAEIEIQAPAKRSN